jgi:hypothetical protein
MAVRRQRTQVFNQPVGVVQTRAGATSVAQSISRAAGTMANLAYRDAVRTAEKTGTDAALAVEEKKLTTIDPVTKKPEAFKAPDGFGQIAAESYQRVIDNRFEESINTEIRLKAEEIALKFPFNPEAYDEAMSDYIGQMSESSGGKYEAYIESTGAKYLALTKLNIQDKVQARARQDASSQLISRLSDNQSEAMMAAAAGNFESAEAIRQKNIGVTKDGIAAKLPNFNAGDDTRTEKAFNKSIAIGGIQFLMDKTQSPAERNQLILYIQSDGKRGIALDKEETNKLLEFIDPTERAEILNYASSVASDYNAVYADLQKASELAADKVARKSLVAFEDNLETFGANSSKGAFDSFILPSRAGESPEMMMHGNYISGFRKVEEIENQVNEMFEAGIGDMTDASRRKRINKAKETFLEPYILMAASDGSQKQIESLKAAFSNPYDRDRSLLTPKQNEFLDILHASEILDNDDIKRFAQTLLESSEDSRKIKIDQIETERLLRTETLNLIDRGNITTEEFNNMSSSIINQSETLGATKVETLISSLRKSMASDRIKAFAVTASSRQLNNLHVYINTSGKKRDGMVEPTIETGNRILSEIKESDKKSVLTEIDSIRVKVESEENKREEELEQLNLIKRISGFGGDSNIRAHREAVDEFLIQNNAPIENFLSWTDKQKKMFLPIVASAIPQRAVEELSSIASGQINPRSETFLSVYQAVGKTAFGNSLTDVEKAFLDDVINIARDSDQPFVQIATEFKLRQESRDSQLNLKTQLKDTTLSQEAMNITKTFGNEADPIIAAEMESVLEYYLLNFNSLDQAKERVKDILNEKYSKSDFIADPRVPMGEITRSRYSLRQKFKDDEEGRLEFLSIIMKSLPKNVTIDGKDISSFTFGPKANISRARRKREVDPDAKLIKLVPIVTPNDIIYSVHFINDANELTPLIYNADEKGNPLKDGNPYNPSFGEKNLVDYRARKAEEIDTETQRLNVIQQERFDVIRGLKKRQPRRRNRSQSNN